MALETLSLQQFGAFKDARFDFCAGLNVLIGANATGKSHAMKAAYSVLRAVQRSKGKDDGDRLALRLAEKIGGVFKPHDEEIGRLVRRGRGSGPSETSTRPTQ